MLRREIGRAICLAVGVTSLISAGPAQADPAVAEVLFREGRELMKEGRVSEACSKFAESQRQDPASGTLINLAACHEAEGRLATAWGEFVAAARLARSEGKIERADEATQRAETLLPRVPHVRLSPPSEPAAAAVFVDGKDLGRAVFGSTMPLDPGKRTIEVKAPGHLPWTTTVELAAGDPLKEIAVPPLVREPTKSSVEPLPPSQPITRPKTLPPPASDDTQIVAGWSVFGVGAAAGTLGAIFGGLALQANGESEDGCPTRTNCSDESVSAFQRADSFAWASNVLIPVGIVTAATGVIVVLTAPSGAAQADQVAVGIVSGKANGLIVRGSF